MYVVRSSVAICWFFFTYITWHFPPQLQHRSCLLRSLLPYQSMKHTQGGLCALPEASQLWISHGGTRTLNSWTQILDWVYNQWQRRVTMAFSIPPLLSPYPQWPGVMQATIPVLQQTLCLVALWQMCSSLRSQWTVSTLLIWACQMWIVMHMEDCRASVQYWTYLVNVRRCTLWIPLVFLVLAKIYYIMRGYEIYINVDMCYTSLDWITSFCGCNWATCS